MTIRPVNFFGDLDRPPPARSRDMRE